MLMNATVQEGDRPSEDPQELISQMRALYGELEELVVRINQTNANTLVDGESITQLIARRERLMSETANLREFLSRANAVGQFRGMKTEIRFVATVDISEYRKDVDKLSAELRELDSKLQYINWTTELI